MSHLSLALPLAILTLPIIVLAVLRILASIADAQIAERSARLVREIEAAARDPKMQPDASPDRSARLTGTPPRDQG
jgi:hypothetical protein